MGAILTLDKRLDKINNTIEGKISEIISITNFADNICRDMRQELDKKNKLIEDYRDTIERQTAIISRFKSQQKKYR
jgi:hypothetical protein